MQIYLSIDVWGGKRSLVTNCKMRTTTYRDNPYLFVILILRSIQLIENWMMCFKAHHKGNDKGIDIVEDNITWELYRQISSLEYNMNCAMNMTNFIAAIWNLKIRASLTWIKNVSLKYFCVYVFRQLIT